MSLCLKKRRRILSRACRFRPSLARSFSPEADIARHLPILPRVGFVADLAHAGRACSRLGSPANGRVALILANYPNRDAASSARRRARSRNRAARLLRSTLCDGRLRRQPGRQHGAGPMPACLVARPTTIPSPPPGEGWVRGRWQDASAGLMGRPPPHPGPPHRRGEGDNSGGLWPLTRTFLEPCCVRRRDPFSRAGVIRRSPRSVRRPTRVPPARVHGRHTSRAEPPERATTSIFRRRASTTTDHGAADGVPACYGCLRRRSPRTPFRKSIFGKHGHSNGSPASACADRTVIPKVRARRFHML